MANYEEAINDVKYLSTRLRGLIELADFLGDASTLENRVAEKTKVLEETNANLTETIAVFNATRDQLAQTREDLAAFINRTNAEADSIRANAAKEAELIILQAHEEYTKIIDKAGLEANIIASSIADAKEELNALDEQILLKAQSLANIETKLQTLRESLNG